MFSSLAPDTPAFPGISANTANWNLRALLCLMKIDGANTYRSHDLRRGHAQDMAECGSSLLDILHAGEWRYLVVIAQVLMYRLGIFDL